MIEARVRGIPDLKAALAGIVPKLRVRALRNALAAGARVIMREARARVPVINSGDSAVQKGYRKPGTVRKAISVRTSKIARRKGDVGVFVNVRPLRGKTVTRVQVYKQRGRLVSRGVTAIEGSSRFNPDDPFYWRWLEFGTKKMRATPFLQPAANKLDEALQVFIRVIGPQITKLNKPKAPAP